jgi:hypothetical protein
MISRGPMTEQQKRNNAELERRFYWGYPIFGPPSLFCRKCDARLDTLSNPLSHECGDEIPSSRAL